MVKYGMSLASAAFGQPEYFANIKKCLLSGYFMQVAKLQRSGVYLTIEDYQTVAIHPSSILDHKPEWLLYNEFVLTKKNYIRTLTEIRGEYLFEVCAGYFNPNKISH